MTTYTVNDDEVTEKHALSLQPNETFTVTFSDGQSVECYRIDGSDAWTVRQVWKGATIPLGAVDLEMHGEQPMYRARNLPQYSAQEFFSAAARKFLS